MSDKKPVKGKEHQSAHRRPAAKPPGADSAKPKSSASKAEHVPGDPLTSGHVGQNDHSSHAHSNAVELMNPGELSQPEASEASQIPSTTEAAEMPEDSQRGTAGPDRKPAVSSRRVLDVFLIDSGWNNEVGKAVRENLPTFAGYLEGQRFFVLNETQSLNFIKRHPALVGADPILIVLDRQAAKEHNPKGFGFRLCLGHMRHPDGAISMMKWAIQLSMASNGTQMATIIKESGHRQTIQGTIELIGEGSAHLLEFAPV